MYIKTIIITFVAALQSQPKMKPALQRERKRIQKVLARVTSPVNDEYYEWINPVGNPLEVWEQSSEKARKPHQKLKIPPRTFTLLRGRPYDRKEYMLRRQHFN